MACCIATAYGSTEQKTSTLYSSEQKITKETLENLAEQLLRANNYDAIEPTDMNSTDYKNSLKEAIKLAIREKVYNAPGAEQLQDIFDNTIGDEATENYLVMRFLCKYMLRERYSLDEALEHLCELFGKRLEDVEMFAKKIDVEGLLGRNLSDLLEELREVTPTGPATTDDASEAKTEVTANSYIETIDRAKDIFEFLKTKTGTDDDYVKACDELLKQMPAQYNTEVLDTSEDIVTKVAQETQQGNNPLVVNWRFPETEAGNLQEYIPALSDSLNKTSDEAQESFCLLSENLQAINDEPEIISDIDLTSTNISNEILSNQKSLQVIARTQILMALLSKHDVLIIDLAGLNLPEEQSQNIRQIYTKELSNPIINGRLKKLLFVISKGNEQYFRS